MASELTPNVSLREAAFLQPPNLATFILGQVVVAARHRRISFYKILAIAWPARKEECSSRCRFHWCTSEWHGGYKDWLRKRVDEQKDITIRKLCAELNEKFNLNVHHSPVWHVVRSFGLSHKKRLFMPRSNTAST